MAKPIEFKAGTLTAMSAVLREIDNVRLSDTLQVMLGGMGEFFAGEATIVDITQVKHFPDRVDWNGLLSLLRRYGLQPVALRGAPEHLHDAARKAGLAILSEQAAALGAASDIQAPVAVEVQPEPLSRDTTPQATPAAVPGTMVINRTIRSGQQIYAKGCDLVVLGAVSNGAEIIADGSIHCYGPLRGRALAGAAGDKSARIYSSNFGPELVAVAGVYRTFEKGIPPQVAGKPAQALLHGGADKQSLALEPLQLD